MKPLPPTTRLSYTYPLQGGSPEPILEARVWVTDSDNIRTDFEEIGNGVYQADSSFRGLIDKEYQLNFTVPGTGHLPVNDGKSEPITCHR